jgi:hypothetical protein
MSELVLVDKYQTIKPVEIISNDGKDILGTFIELHCEKHGDTLNFTDIHGSDHCIECIKEMTL